MLEDGGKKEAAAAGTPIAGALKFPPQSISYPKTPGTDVAALPWPIHSMQYPEHQSTDPTHARQEHNPRACAGTEW